LGGFEHLVAISDDFDAALPPELVDAFEGRTDDPFLLPRVSEVTVHEAKTNLSRLLVRVEAGEEIVIKRGKMPVARLVRAKPRPVPILGIDEGVFDLPDDFNEMSQEELAVWEADNLRI
jgi:prevent-host-death family protein